MLGHAIASRLDWTSTRCSIGNIFQKLSVTDRAGAISAAVRRNLGDLSTTREA